MISFWFSFPPVVPRLVECHGNYSRSLTFFFTLLDREPHLAKKKKSIYKTLLIITIIIHKAVSLQPPNDNACTC